MRLKVRAAVLRQDGGALFWVADRVRFDAEDDGPGIAEKRRTNVPRRGRRVDSSSLDAGVGLAIVTDILYYCAHELVLERSPLGGHKASFALAT